MFKAHEPFSGRKPRGEGRRLMDKRGNTKKKDADCQTYLVFYGDAKRLQRG